MGANPYGSGLGRKARGRAAGEAKAAEGRLLGELRRKQAFLLGYSAGVRRGECRTTRLKVSGGSG